jgi:hypothetical protein
VVSWSAACLDARLPGVDDRDGSGAIEDGGARGAPDAAAGQGGATLLAPPPGSPAPINLAAAVVGLGETIDLAPVTVREDGGRVVDASARFGAPDDPRCAGWGDGRCVIVDLAEPLATHTLVTIDLGGGAKAAFRTGAAWDVDAPGGSATAVSSDGCVVARVQASEAVWATLVVEGRRAPAAGLAVAHEIPLIWLAADDGRIAPVSIEVVDLAGHLTTISGGTVVALVDPGWSISEVLANPAGPEPAQEWIEIVRLADTPGSLAGLRIGDGAATDVLPDTVVPPGGRALVVPSGFDATAPGDVAPLPGTPIARLEGTTIGQSGLANTGEPAVLLDASGRALSILGAHYDVSGASWSGRSVERIAPGCDVATNVLPNDSHASTPGAPNSVE